MDSDAGEVITKKDPAKRAGKKVADFADDAISTIASGGSVLLMTSSGGSWTTPSGVEFKKEAPYQFVPAEEIESLLKSGRFRRAEPQEVKEFYKIEL
jgi:hypothetical protein